MTEEKNPFSITKEKDVEQKPELKPVERIELDISSIKNELTHIKNYLRKLEIRLQLEDQKKDDEYQKVEKGWWW
jgi:hypothetical protein